MLHGDQIRILDLLPCEDGNDESLIRCELRIVVLEDDPEFDALSYCWGTNNNNHQQIKLSDRYKEIPVNLHAALRRLRLRDRKRQLWVDQLCIDQDNTEEKIHQVRMMSRIYSTCRWCLIWLGDLEDGSRELAEASAAAEVIECLADEDATISWNLRSENIHYRYAACDAARGVHAMGPESHSWWRRIWTYQEAVLPKRKSILWGPLVVPWQSLTKARSRAVVGGQLHNILVNMSAVACYHRLPPGSKCLSNLLMNVEYINTVAPGGDDLLLLVMKTRSRRDAHQPHDKILGMLGLVSTQQAPNSHKCNYETSPAQVFSAATIDMILARGLLPLLMDPRIAQGKGTADIPRWAIDMANLPDHGTDHFYQLWGYFKYNACAGRALDMETFQNAMAEQPGQHQFLGLKGVPVDSVKVLADDRLFNSGTRDLDAAIPRTLQTWRALARSCVGHSPMVCLITSWTKPLPGL